MISAKIHPLIESYFNNGLSLVAGTPRDRRPYAPGWNEWHPVKIRDLEHYMQLMEYAPNLNIMIHGAESGLVQVDPDSPEAMTWAIEHGLDNKNAWVIESARGRKTLYRVPPNQELPKTHTSGTHEFPDFINELCLAPPSIHPSGLRLEFTKGFSPMDTPYSELAVLPQSLLFAWIELKPIRPPRQYSSNPPLQGLQAIFDAIVEKMEPVQWFRFKPDGGIFGRCPFPENHTNGDRKPSFGMHPEKGWKCFSGCGEGKIAELAIRLGITEL